MGGCCSTRDGFQKPKYITYGDKSCDDFVNKYRDEQYQYSISKPQSFWDKEAKNITWFDEYKQIIDTSDEYLHRWFPDGTTNMAYNCLDRHVDAGEGDRVCFYEDSVYTGVQREWTYAQVLE